MTTSGAVHIGGSVEGDTAVLGHANLVAQEAALAQAVALLGAGTFTELVRRTVPVTGDISVGGSIKGGTVVVGHGNVVIGGRPAIDRAFLERLPPRVLVDLVRLVAPTDELLAHADALGLLPGPPDTLERLVRPGRPALDPPLWRRRLAALEQVVGLVEHEGVPRGTCFLVGPDLVLTNHHVVAPLIARGTHARELVIRFDYKHGDETFSTPGVTFPLADAGWLVDHTPPTDDELASAEGPASTDHLDHALLRLATPAGDDRTLGRPRGWLDLRAARTPSPGDPLLILQHPLGARLKLTFGAILRWNDQKTRLRYDTNTEPGASGAPCFDDALELVALHHMSDPASLRGRAPAYNEGIPLPLITARLAGKGLPLTGPPA